MPEALEAPPAAPSGGIESMIAAKFSPPVETPPAPATPPAAPPKPADAPPVPTTPKDGIEAKPAAKEKTGFDEEWTPEVEAKLRKLYPEHKMWRVKDIVENKYKSSEAALKSKLAELEARPQTPANDAKIAELEKLIAERDERLKEHQQRLEESDFTKGETYRKEFLVPYLDEKQLAIEEVESLTVNIGTEEEPKTRSGSKNDFEDLLKLGPSQQDTLGKKLFGDSWHRVSDSLKTLKRIRAASEKATREYAANFEKNRLERELAAKRESTEFDNYFRESFSGLSKDPDFGSYVSESETDPEGTALFKAELNKFDSFNETMPKLAPKERAATLALIRARFAAEPRRAAESKRDKAKIASLEADLAKLRGADPGAPVKTVTGAPPAEEPKGIDGLMARMDWGGKQ